MDEPKMVAKGRAYCCFCLIFVIMFLLGFGLKGRLMTAPAPFWSVRVIRRFPKTQWTPSQRVHWRARISTVAQPATSSVPGCLVPAHTWDCHSPRVLCDEIMLACETLKTDADAGDCAQAFEEEEKAHVKAANAQFFGEVECMRVLSHSKCRIPLPWLRQSTGISEACPLKKNLNCKKPEKLHFGTLPVMKAMVRPPCGSQKFVVKHT